MSIEPGYRFCWYSLVIRDSGELLRTGLELRRQLVTINGIAERQSVSSELLRLVARIP
jgi:hypothetical protein